MVAAPRVSIRDQTTSRDVALAALGALAPESILPEMVITANGGVRDSHTSRRSAMSMSAMRGEGKSHRNGKGGTQGDARQSLLWDDEFEEEAEQEANESMARTSEFEGLKRVPLCSLYQRPATIVCNSASQVRGWEIGRSLLFDFGNRYRLRIDAYMGAFLLVVIILVLASGIHLMIARGANAMSLQVLYCLAIVLLVLLCPIVSMLLLLVTANEITAMHRQYLCKLAFGIRQQIEQMDQDEELNTEVPQGAGFVPEAPKTVQRKLEQAATVLYETAEKLDVDDVSSPFTVFGFRASFGVVSALMSLLAIIASYLGTLVVDVVDNHYNGFFKSMEATATINSTLSCG